MKIINAVGNFVNAVLSGIGKFFNRVVEYFTGKSEPKAKVASDVAEVVNKDNTQTLRQRKVGTSEETISKKSEQDQLEKEVTPQQSIDLEELEGKKIIEKRSVQETIRDIWALRQALTHEINPATGTLASNAIAAEQIQAGLKGIVRELGNENLEVRSAALDALNQIIAVKKWQRITPGSQESGKEKFRLSPYGAEVLANSLREFLEYANDKYYETQLEVFTIISNLVKSHNVHSDALNKLKDCLTTKEQSPTFQDPNAAVLIRQALLFIRAKGA